MTFKKLLTITALIGIPTLIATAAFADAPPPAKDPASKSAPKDETASVEEVVVTGRFLDTGARSASKLDIDVKDTPMSVAAYTGSFMKAVETNQVADLYRYMTGISRAGNTGYDLTLRGFKTSGNDRNAIMTDGLPGLTVRFGSPPTIGTDHIEVVKGPASILYGQTQPGGFVNIITKKPRATPSTDVEVRTSRGVGSFNRAKGVLGAIDSTGPLDSNGTFLYRLVAQAGYTDGFRTNSYDRPVYIAPSLTWNVSDKTRATLELEYRTVKTHYDTYLVAPHKDITFVAPIDTSYQEPGDYLKETGKTATLFVNHDFSDHLRGNFSYRYVDHDDVAKGFDVVAVLPTFTGVSRRARGQDNKRTYSFGDANLVGDFEVAGIRNKFVVGANYGTETADLNRLQFFNAPTSGAQSLNISVINPVYGVAGPLDSYPLVNSTTPTNLNDRYSTNKATGLYMSDLITFTDQFKAMVGLRYAKEELTIQELKLTGVPTQSATTSSTLPMVGLLYEPNEHLSFYTSYSTSYVPVPASNIDVNGLYSFTPTTASSIEYGVKGDYFRHHLTFTFAEFDIKKKNVINTFSCPFGTCSNQVGAEEARGFELEADARPIDQWQITAGWSHINGRVTSTNIAAQAGAELTNVPLNAAHLWTRYDVPEGAFKNLGFGFGISYTGQRTGLLPTASSSAVMPLPEYTVADAAIYYRFRNMDITFKVSNLTDKIYYESAGFTGDINIVPGEPRTATLSFRAHF